MKILLTAVVFLYTAIFASAGPLYSYNITFALSAEELPRRDHFSQPDAFVQVYSYVKSWNADVIQRDLQLIGSTKYIRDEVNPDWVEAFTFTWKRGTGQTWLIKVIDHDHTNPNDLIGIADVSVDRFMASRGNFRVHLSHGGSVIIKRTMPIAFTLCAKNLPPRDRYLGSKGTSDPYAIVSYRDDEDGTDKPFHRTAVLTNNADPSWEETIEFSKYQPNAHQTLHFQLFDRDLFSRDEMLGEAFIQADELTERSGRVVVSLVNSYENASIILTVPSHQQRRPLDKIPDLHLTSFQPLQSPVNNKLDSASAEVFSGNQNEIYEVIPK